MGVLFAQQKHIEVYFIFIDWQLKIEETLNLDQNNVPTPKNAFWEIFDAVGVIETGPSPVPLHHTVNSAWSQTERTKL